MYLYNNKQACLLAVLALAILQTAFGHVPDGIKVYCDPNLNAFSGGTGTTGHWALVRHVPAGGLWHPANDAALGNDTYNVNPQVANLLRPDAPFAFSYQYNTWSFNFMLFATVDFAHYAVVESTGSVLPYSNGNQNLVIHSSDVYPTGPAYEVVWYNRGTSSNLEDPWISNQDHFYGGTSFSTDNEGHSQLYGENSFNGWLHWKNNHGGANVWVQVPSMC